MAGLTVANPATGPNGVVMVTVTNPATQARPAGAHVMWLGGATQPVNMVNGDLWIKDA